MPGLVVGMMSGTSLDGVDAVVADFSADTPRAIAHAYRPFPPTLRAELLALNRPAQDEIRRAALAANALSALYADLVRRLLTDSSIEAQDIVGIGCHGQTIRHQPHEGYTVQLVNGALLAELTNIDVVCDFRSGDIAAGGEGAPLAPAFHRAAFADATVHRAIVNIGGISNLTSLPTHGDIQGFDCGPGNVLLDTWAQRHQGVPFDRDGAWAQTGLVLPTLLSALLDHDYFSRAPPKSAGRDTFELDWLMQHLDGGERAADVQATLLALSAAAIANAVETFCAGAKEIYACGGGARNAALLEVLRGKLKNVSVATTDALGVQAEHVEALAFALLARLTLTDEPGNVPSVTGARRVRVLGAIYRGR